MHLIWNRSLLFAASCLVVAAALGTGCSSDTATVSSSGTAGTGAGTELTEPSAVTGSTALAQLPGGTASGIPETTIPDPNTSLPAPDPTAAPTIPAGDQDPALLDCGTLFRASGWPTTFVPSIEAFTCLQAAFDAGTPARLVDREQTDGYGGAILITTYDVLGPGNVRVTVDAREAADRPKGITVSECTGLTAVPMTITPSGCTVVSS